MQDPQSLHKYAYVHGDPVQRVDPTGLFGATSSFSGLTVGQMIVGATAIATLGVLTVAAESNPGAFRLPTFRWPSFEMRWVGQLAGWIIAAEMTRELAEKIAEHSVEQGHLEEFDDLGILDEEALADLVEDIVNGALAGEEGYLVKEGLDRLRTAVRDLAEEIVVVWDTIGGSIYRPTNPDYHWNNLR
jgi:hypothetical protein